MRAVVQRVSSASVTVDEQIVGRIGNGFLVLLGISATDTTADLQYLTSKLIGLRIFEDDEGKMNLSIKDVSGSMLIISQFTLYGDCRKGRRPSFLEAARPEHAEPIYQEFASIIRNAGVPVETGTFQAHMDVQLVNDGPVTFILDSSKLF